MSRGLEWGMGIGMVRMYVRCVCGWDLADITFEDHLEMDEEDLNMLT